LKAPIDGLEDSNVSLLEVKLDASKLTAWASELSTRGMRNAIRRAVDQSARYARKVTIKVIAADIGVSASKIKAAVPKIQTTTAGNLSARWTVKSMRISIADVSGAKISRGTGLQASTERLTGGGSASLDVSKAFLVQMANGARFVAYRKGKERLPLKGVYAETPATALGQEGAAANKAWKQEADKQLAARLPVEIQKALLKEGLSANTPDLAD
jgi:hypothetical protein